MVEILCPYCDEKIELEDILAIVDCPYCQRQVTTPRQRKWMSRWNRIEDWLEWVINIFD